MALHRSLPEGTRVLAVRTQMGQRLQPVFHVVTVLPAAFFEQRVSQPCDFLMRWLNDCANRYFHRVIPLRVVAWLMPVSRGLAAGSINALRIKPLLPMTNDALFHSVPFRGFLSGLSPADVRLVCVRTEPPTAFKNREAVARSQVASMQRRSPHGRRFLIEASEQE
jgi:hypothetical protein